MEEQDTIIFSDLSETIDFKASLPLALLIGLPTWYHDGGLYTIPIQNSEWSINIRFDLEGVEISAEGVNGIRRLEYPIKREDLENDISFFRLCLELKI